MNIDKFLKFNAVLPNRQARLVSGPAGIGKSAVTKQFAGKIGFKFVDLRLSELEPADLVGMPFIKDERTYYAAPWWWPNKGDKTVLFLDEIDRCSADMQPLAMQLTLDRRCGGRDLPEDTVVFAACNGTKYMTSDIDQALINRFALIELSPDASEWIKWASDNLINKSVIEYIADNNRSLDTPEEDIGRPNKQVPTRRSWSNLGQAINAAGGNIEMPMTDFAEPFVGKAEAARFSRWLSSKFKEIKPESVFDGEVKAESLSVIEISTLAKSCANKFMNPEVTRDMRANCLNLFMESGAEIFSSFFAELPKEAAAVISEIPKVDNYIKTIFGK